MSNKQIPQGDLGSFQTFMDIVETLHAPGGCPWDREQTHESLKRHLLEESYEVIEAIDQGNPAVLSEELGDLMVQSAVLQLPHPRFRSRSFVLEPLAEIAPALVDPATGKTVAQLNALLR